MKFRKIVGATLLLIGLSQAHIMMPASGTVPFNSGYVQVSLELADDDMKEEKQMDTLDPCVVKPLKETEIEYLNTKTIEKENCQVLNQAYVPYDRMKCDAVGGKKATSMKVNYRREVSVTGLYCNTIYPGELFPDTPSDNEYGEEEGYPDCATVKPFDIQTWQMFNMFRTDPKSFLPFLEDLKGKIKDKKLIKPDGQTWWFCNGPPKVQVLIDFITNEMEPTHAVKWDNALALSAKDMVTDLSEVQKTTRYNMPYAIKMIQKHNPYIEQAAAWMEQRYLWNPLFAVADLAIADCYPCTSRRSNMVWGMWYKIGINTQEHSSLNGNGYQQWLIEGLNDTRNAMSSFEKVYVPQTVDEAWEMQAKWQDEPTCSYEVPSSEDEDSKYGDNEDAPIEDEDAPIEEEVHPSEDEGMDQGVTLPSGLKLMPSTIPDQFQTEINSFIYNIPGDWKKCDCVWDKKGIKLQTMYNKNVFLDICRYKCSNFLGDFKQYGYGPTEEKLTVYHIKNNVYGFNAHHTRYVICKDGMFTTAFSNEPYKDWIKPGDEGHFEVFVTPATDDPADQKMYLRNVKYGTWVQVSDQKVKPSMDNIPSYDNTLTENRLMTCSDEDPTERGAFRGPDY